LEVLLIGSVGGTDEGAPPNGRVADVQGGMLILELGEFGGEVAASVAANGV